MDRQWFIIYSTDGHVFQTFSFQCSFFCFHFCLPTLYYSNHASSMNKLVPSSFQTCIGISADRSGIAGSESKRAELAVFLSRRLLSVGTATGLCLSVIQEHAFFLMDLKRFLKYQIGGFQPIWKIKKNAILVHFFHYLFLLVILCVCESYWKYVLIVSLIAVLKSLIVCGRFSSWFTWVFPSIWHCLHTVITLPSLNSTLSFFFF